MQERFAVAIVLESYLLVNLEVCLLVIHILCCVYFEQNILPFWINV
jgi:hypothetical protein